MRLIPATCPKCSAQIEVPDNLQKAHCMYCGTTILIESNSPEINKLKNYIILVNKYYEKGEYKKAIEQCEQAMVFDPNNKDIDKVLFLACRDGYEKYGKAYQELKEKIKKQESLNAFGALVGGSQALGNQNLNRLLREEDELKENIVDFDKIGKLCLSCHGQTKLVCNNCNGKGFCPRCAGKGSIGVFSRKSCPVCEGSGKCGKCNGTKKMKCSTCKGTGKTLPLFKTISRL